MHKRWTIGFPPDFKIAPDNGKPIGSSVSDRRDTRDAQVIGDLIIRRDDKHLRSAHECHDLMEQGKWPQKSDYPFRTTQFPD